MRKKCLLIFYFLYSRDKMGRRKSKRKPPPKKKMTGNLDTQFTCPFCNHEKSCDVKMWVISVIFIASWKALINGLHGEKWLFSRERTRNTGIISCSVCLEEFQTPITCILFDQEKEGWAADLCSLIQVTSSLKLYVLGALFC